MSNLCLPKQNRNKLRNALKSGDISIEKLYKMTDAERNIIFRQYVGKDFAPFVNGKFEQAMLSNQKKAMVNWIEQTTKFKDPIRRDMIKKVERIKKVLSPNEESGFLKDLAEMKLGINVTEEEAKTILNLKKNIDELEIKLPEKNGKIPTGNTTEELSYGYAIENFKTYVGELKLQAETLKFKERFKPTNFGKNIVDFAGVTKSMKATLDDSFLGRQGIKVLTKNPKLWAETAVLSFKNFAKELVAKGSFRNRNDAVMASMRARVYADPNFRNGKYNASKNGYGLGVMREEAFPSSFPEKIPLLGRVFKASETAFNGSALYLRHKLANAVITNAEKNGIDMLDEAQATAHAMVVTSMTGRGELGKVSAIGRETNALFFSIRFLKSNWDTITAHQFNKAMTPAAKALARKNLAHIATTLGSVLSVAKMIDPDSTDLDPRSGKFGKICSDNHCYDITGGMSGLVRFAFTSIIPTMHDGKWGLWKYNQRTRKWSNLAEAGFGEETALDSLERFFEGKLSPLAGAVRDWLKGQNFSGDKPNFVNTTIGLTTPISFEMFIEELQKGNSDIITAMFAESIGFSPSNAGLSDYGTKWQALKNKVDNKTYNEALKKVTENFNKRADRLEKSSRFERMNNEERSKELNKIKREETEKVLSRYGI